MKILDISPAPLHTIPYLNAGPGKRVVTEHLCIYQGSVDSLPTGVAGLILASDLQGRDRHSNANGEHRLLGETLAEELRTLARLGTLPPVEHLGILLAGDLYSRPQLDRRGGSGDVRGVWRAFVKAGFRWVTGVAGNHDVFGDQPSVPDFEAFIREPGIYFLDGNSVCLDGLQIGGVSGIVGNPRRHFRRTESDCVDEVCKQAEQADMDIVLLHDGPAILEHNLPGCAMLSEMLEILPPTLVIRGHKPWDPWVSELKNGTQVINLDHRAIVLTQAKGHGREE